MFRVPILLILAVLLAACGQGQSASDDATSSVEAAPSADESAGASGPGESAGAGDTVEVTAVDYAFSGLPSEVEAGTTFSFTNEGTEVHELVLIRRNDDVELSFSELLEMPEEEAMELATVVGGIVAEPGETAEDTITVEEPGDYLAVCFVPVGTTSLEDAESVDGPPHFIEGMLHEFTVTE